MLATLSPFIASTVTHMQEIAAPAENAAVAAAPAEKAAAPTTPGIGFVYVCPTAEGVAFEPYAIGVKPSDTTLSYNYCVVQSVSPSCCMYLLDDVSTLHFTVWDFNLFTPNEQIGGIVSLEGLHVGGFSGHISGTSIDLSVEVTRAPVRPGDLCTRTTMTCSTSSPSRRTPFAEVPNSFQYCVAANHFLSAETMHLAMCAECQTDYAESAFDSQFSPTAEHAGIFLVGVGFATVWQCVCDYGGYEMMSSVLGTCMAARAPPARRRS